MYKRDYYLTHKEYFARNKRRAAMVRRRFINALKCRPCADCGDWFDPWIMQFDHLDKTKKTHNISQMEGRSFQAIKEEADKCDVVCANCHANRTYKRRPVRRV